jgi:hypothetical protein
VTIGIKILLKNLIMLKNKDVKLFKFFYINCLKLHYALVDFKKVVVFSYFNMTIYIEFQLFDY